MPSVSLISLGCPKNLIDSERALSNLSGSGFDITPVTEDADIVVVNTCGFIDSAKEESIETLLSVARPQTDGKRPIVIATGCFSERYGPDLAREMPEIDAYLGLGDYARLPEIAHALLRGRPDAPQVYRSPLPDRPTRALRPHRLTPRHYAYLRISEGCDNPCTFCSIPDIRGRFTSKPPREILAEAKQLVADGCRELILVAQDLTDYGLDLVARRSLADLLELLDQESGAHWIRLLYAYPAHLEENMLDAIARLDTVIPYLDIPIQHASTGILRRMARRMTTESTYALIQKVRDRIPGVILRTSIIVGFPGETEADHQTLLEFLQTARIDRLGTFTYSDEENTPSFRIQEKVDPETMQRRQNEVMEIQQAVAFERAEQDVGKHLEIVLDGPDPDQENRWLARTQGDCPEIDPVVHLNEEADLSAGDFHNALITGTSGYDLVAQLAPAPPSSQRPKS
ncbi:MAG: 30S ribosomal protein S12 methylthiotransferase RimO [Planctomycetota bacterium]|jgi:ribosomal protein S12 methylthiotransferase|nr:30S ribosomal protein S12 methylthiotransferase RimO [Planctomycetota bacterium]